MDLTAFLPARRAAARPGRTSTRHGLLQRKCACGGNPGADGECEACRKKKLQRKAGAPPIESSGAPAPIVHEVLRTPGQPLDRTTREFMEPRFGCNFANVRVHTDAKAAEAARAACATAFTVGEHIVFSSGQFAPSTAAGLNLIGHELAHTIQQQGLEAGTMLPADHRAERAANAAADDAVADRPATRPLEKISPSVARQETDDAGIDAGAPPADASIPGGVSSPADDTTVAAPASSATPASSCPSDWQKTVQDDRDRGLGMLDTAITKLGSYDGTTPANVKTALENSFHASGSAFAGWVRLNLRFLHVTAPAANYQCESTGKSWWCDPGTLAETFWCVPLVDVRVCAPIYFAQTPLERSTTLIHEWVHKYGCNFDLGYRTDPGYLTASTLKALVNADPFAQLVKDVQ